MSGDSTLDPVRVRTARAAWVDVRRAVAVSYGGPLACAGPVAAYVRRTPYGVAGNGDGAASASDEDDEDAPPKRKRRRRGRTPEERAAVPGLATGDARHAEAVAIGTGPSAAPMASANDRLTSSVLRPLGQWTSPVEPALAELKQDAGFAAVLAELADTGAEDGRAPAPRIAWPALCEQADAWTRAGLWPPPPLDELLLEPTAREVDGYGRTGRP